MTSKDELRAQIEANRRATHGDDFRLRGKGGANVDVLEGRKPMVAPRQRIRVPEAHRLGALALVQIGTCVYSAERWHATSEEPVGGIVVSIDERLDEETGEHERVFTVVGHYFPPVRTWRIREAEVVETGVELAQPSELSALIGALCGEVYQDLGVVHGRKSRGFATPAHGERIDWARRLYKAAIGAAA